MVYGTIADIFFQWENLGVFDFLLPFLLIFAIVFGILNATRFMGKSKGIYVIIALVVALMSLRYQYFFSDFISELFPRLGIGLAILLVLMIVLGLFIAKDERRYWGWGLAVVAFIIGIVIIFQAFDRLGYIWGMGFLDSEFIGFIVLAILLVGIIIAVAAGGREKEGVAKTVADFIGWRKND